MLKVLPIFLVFALAVFTGYIFIQQNRSQGLIDQISQRVSTANSGQVGFTPTSSPNSGCNDACKEEIKRQVAAFLSSTPAPTKVPVSAPATKQTTYIPLGSTYSTTSTTWTDVPTAQIGLSTADYGSSPAISWEAFLKVANANGTAYVRLYDATHNIAVDASELSVSNTSTSTYVGSGNLNLWSGRNQYKVQIKSLNSLEVTYEPGRIRIVY